MLSTDTTHVLTDVLIDVEAEAHRHAWGRLDPVLLFIQDRPLPGDACRQMRISQLPFDPDHLATHAGGMTAVMHGLATALASTDPDILDDPDDPGSQGDDGDAAGEHADSDGGAWRTVAWAVLYEDLDTSDERISAVRRVEAVDADGRVYQVARHPDQATPRVRVDPSPDPTDIPATHPALTALLAVTSG